MAEGRRVAKEIELDATPEQVWGAISTGPGFSVWFVPHEIEPGIGGKCHADFGSGNIAEGRVLEWDQGRRVVYGGSNDDPGEALEFLVEARDGGTAVLRFVQSGFTAEDWEAEYHSRGWDVFFHNLSSYFQHFAGLPVVNALAMSFTPLGREAVWEKFHTALGVAPAVQIGDRVDLTPEGVEPISGVVDLRWRGLLGIRTENALYRFGGEGADAWGMVNVCHYLYGTDRERVEETASWRAWLERLFPAPTVAENVTAEAYRQR
ncbi:MAG TPA: SRPBCC domain-containing protein [Pseudonocardia sp.]|uniref:SRPBCC family protein n=1 Tax=Pseudonocardia sp. TaxID=60912 RepID=UPI002C801925|nr:SRPBCC domain-containing protein [Pseudonocardia sp.]HTF46564.1 SRPBCC domain-containing protein [Pseudonocardia sp.]